MISSEVDKAGVHSPKYMDGGRNKGIKLRSVAALYHLIGMVMVETYVHEGIEHGVVQLAQLHQPRHPKPAALARSKVKYLHTRK